jgi:uncharacterized membrane protein YgcG
MSVSLPTGTSKDAPLLPKGGISSFTCPVKFSSGELVTEGLALLHGDTLILSENEKEQQSGCFSCCSAKSHPPLKLSLVVKDVTLTPGSAPLHVKVKANDAIYEITFSDAKTWATFADVFNRMRGPVAPPGAASVTGNPLVSPAGGAAAFPIPGQPPPPRLRAHVLARASMNLGHGSAVGSHVVASDSSTASMLRPASSASITAGTTSTVKGGGATVSDGDNKLLSPPQVASPERTAVAGQLGDSGLTRADFLKRLEDKLKSTAASRNQALCNIAASGGGNAAGGSGSGNSGGSGSGGGGITGMASIDITLLPSLPPFEPPPAGMAADDPDYKERKYRHSVYNEILESEKRYFRDLQVLRDVFEIPLRK